MNGIRYRREIFASVPDQVIAVRLTADCTYAFNFRASVDRPSDFVVRAIGHNALVQREGPDFGRMNLHIRATQESEDKLPTD